MELNPVPTELTTAATDLLLAVLAGVGIALLHRRRAADPRRARLWSAVLGALAGSALLGTAVHGLDLSADVRNALWVPLFLLLAVTVALFAVAAVFDHYGARAARRALPIALGGAAAFLALTFLLGGAFVVFVAFEAAAMLLALILYLRLAFRDALPGAGLLAAGVLLNIVAGAVQASSLRVTVVWPFDHNGLFHIVQAVAVVVLLAGLLRGPGPVATASPGP